MKKVRPLALLVALTTVVLAAPAAARAADTIYWANMDADTVSFATLDGAQGGDLATNVESASGLAIDSATGRLYYVSESEDRIGYVNLDGSGGGNLDIGGAPIDGAEGLAIDPAARIIYWANYRKAGLEGLGETIGFARLDGSGGGTLNTTGATVEGPSGLTVDPEAGRIYWANFFKEGFYGDGETIGFANLDGSGGGDLATPGATPTGPAGVAIDPGSGRIFWTNFEASTIGYANLNGSGSGELPVPGGASDAPWGLAIDSGAGKLYWANAGTDSLEVSGLDGAGAALLATPSVAPDYPNSPVLLEEPVGQGLPGIGGGQGLGSALTCSQGAWAGDQIGAFLYRAPQSYAYQWSLNGAPIAGATSSTVTASAAGEYRCSVTASNHAGAKTQTSDPHGIVIGTAHVARVAKVRKGRALMKLRCGPLACVGEVKLTYRRKSHKWTFGKASFKLAAGESKVVRVKLRGKAKKLLAESKNGRLKVGASGAGVTARKLVLKLP